MKRSFSAWFMICFSLYCVCLFPMFEIILSKKGSHFKPGLFLMLLFLLITKLDFGLEFYFPIRLACLWGNSFKSMIKCGLMMSFFSQDSISLCNSPSYPGTSSCRPGWLWTHWDSPAYISQVLGLKAWVTTTRFMMSFLMFAGFVNMRKILG